jgi:hypothetical protein
MCGARLFVLSIDTQAGLELVAAVDVAVAVAAAVAVVVRNGAKFSQCSMA